MSWFFLQLLKEGSTETLVSPTPGKKEKKSPDNQTPATTLKQERSVRRL